MTQHFEPSWDAPLDVEGYLRAVPPTAMIKGFFGATVVAAAKQRGITLAGAAEKYIPFKEYPLSQHNRLLVEAASTFWPDITLRQGLRKIGRAAVGSLLETTFGKALLGGLTQPDAVMIAMTSLSRAYTTTLTHPTPVVEVISTGDRSAVMRLRDTWCFLDCQQVGIVEGLCRLCGTRATVRIATDGPASGELAFTWEPAAASQLPGAV
jgi:uncharacterized protein (TIGR02265 family)